MDRQMFVYHSLLCVWCLLNAGHTVFVTAQPRALARIITPLADIKEGGRVDMKCSATGIGGTSGSSGASGAYTAEWTTEESIPANNNRFMISTINTGLVGIQYLNITNLTRDDSNVYICNARRYGQIVATDSVTLSVLYFPNESFPMCLPNGPTTVEDGTELNIRCTSEAGNSAVMMNVYKNCVNESAKSNCYMMSGTRTDSDTISWSLGLQMDDYETNDVFECIISSSHFPSRNGSCIMGPFTVTARQPTQGGLEPESPSTNPLSTTPGSQMTTFYNSDLSCALVPWIAAFIVSIILLVVSCITNVVVILRVFRLKRLNKSLTEKTSPVPKSDPYMELQPTDDKNREYMEPETRETTTAYYQTIEAEKEHTDDDYEVTAGNVTGTTYESVGVPKDDQKRYQNIKL